VKAEVEKRAHIRDLYSGFKALAEGGFTLLERRIVAVKEYAEAALKGRMLILKLENKMVMPNKHYSTPTESRPKVS
jgi:hypothetical protein